MFDDYSHDIAYGFQATIVIPNFIVNFGPLLTPLT